jgi:hypothetical protein
VSSAAQVDGQVLGAAGLLAAAVFIFFPAAAWARLIAANFFFDNPWFGRVQQSR